MIELLVVIVMIGILTSFALPTYQDYATRARVIELFALAQPAKLAVTEALISNTPDDRINNEDLGLGAIENIGKVKNIVIEDAVITIIGDSTALNLDEDLIIALTPKKKSGIIDWECTTSPDQYKKYAPKNCLSASSIPEQE